MVPQAKAGRAATSADSITSNKGATNVAATAGLDSALPNTSAAADAGYGGTESLVWGWVSQLATCIKDQINRMKPKLLGRPEGRTVPQVVPVQLGSNAKQSYRNSTHGRHLLAGTSALADVWAVEAATLTPNCTWVSALMCIVQGSCRKSCCAAGWMVQDSCRRSFSE